MSQSVIFEAVPVGAKFLRFSGNLATFEPLEIVEIQTIKGA